MKRYVITLEAVLDEDANMNNIEEFDWHTALQCEEGEWVSVIMFRDEGEVVDEDEDEDLTTDPYGVKYGGCE